MEGGFNNVDICFVFCRWWTMVPAQWKKWISPPQEVESVHTHQDVPIGIHFEQVSIHSVKHQTSEEEWRQVMTTERELSQRQKAHLSEAVVNTFCHACVYTV